MTVKQLRKALENVPDNFPVYIDTLSAPASYDDFAEVKGANARKIDGLLENHFCITMGDVFSL